MSESKPLSESTPADIKSDGGLPYQRTFDELLLNPSVVRSDEQRLSAQSRKIFNLLRDRYRYGKGATTNELAAISRQYGSRIYEIRRFLLGREFSIDVTKRGPNGNNEYALVPIGRSQFYRDHREKLQAERRMSPSTEGDTKWA